jgi:LssY C-terminus
MSTLVFCILTAAILFSCAKFEPTPINENPLQKRARNHTKKGVSISAAVLSEEEAKTMFGLPLYEKGIQPVWLEIKNDTQYRMWFPQVSMDRNYFAPLEVAYLYHSGYAKASKQDMDAYFHKHAMGHLINPGTVRSGFVFTNLELGTKAFNLDVIGDDHSLRTFTFILPVEGLRPDHSEVDWKRLFADHDKIAFDSSGAFRQALEELPCCTTDMTGSRLADPINLILIGDSEAVLSTLLKSGWDETASASSHTPKDQLPWEFRYEPVKPLYFFNRPQDAAFRKSRSTLNERNQLRLWMSPFSYNGKQVWVGQISRILRPSAWSRFILEPDVDQARTYLLQDLWYTQALIKYGYIKSMDIATIASPRKGLVDDTYFTDGLCLVMWIADTSIPLSNVQFVEWDKPVRDRKKRLLGR